MENKNELTQEAISKLKKIVEVTRKRVKEITMGEIDYIFKHLNNDEIHLIGQAVRSGNEERIKASINIPIYRIMQEFVSGERQEPII